MAPKTTINASKQAAILSWFQRTALAYSIKDLEKLLPSVAPISGMAVKDYLQALQDDSQIRAEKIGSGNWYWSFPSEAKKGREMALAKAQAEFDRAEAVVREVQGKVDQAQGEREEGGELLADTGGDRKMLVARHAERAERVEKLRKELAAYSECDPVELDRKIEDTRRERAAAEKFSEHIYCMEGWLKDRVPDRESQIGALRDLYGDEWDEEEGGLRELA